MLQIHKQVCYEICRCIKHVLEGSNYTVHRASDSRILTTKLERQCVLLTLRFELKYSSENTSALEQK